ncbi:hypothetical protein PSE_p0019 (plasmid) [Pseudovibrio sp. FO-BEG1]|nr:hypothetical protein PSE_p0019 [Pseudovibrio sp. FO-BEG1]
MGFLKKTVKSNKPITPHFLRGFNGIVRGATGNAQF